MKLQDQVKSLSIGWDGENWGRCFDFWQQFFTFRNKRVLELGCGCENAGLSLWAAIEGAGQVLCTDYCFPRDITISIHRNCGFDSVISYAEVDALNIPYSSEFDLIIFKSMLGGIVRKNDLSVVSDILSGIAKALKSGGIVAFAENLEGSFFHRFFRAKFGAGKNNWRYFKGDELSQMLAKINDLEIIAQQNVGVLGCFGRSESHRVLLGKLDRLFFERLFPDSYRYIQFIVARKK